VTDFLNQHFELNPGIAVRRIKDELFFITPASAELHTLNESGIEIWDLVQSGKSPAEIIEKLVAETDGEPEAIRSDIQELFDLFIAKGILRERP
jgi:hypothetical protein